jgi:Uma2 family endonuclease
MAAILETVIDTDREYEIINGQPEEKIMGGARHGGIGARLIIELGIHVKVQHLGSVYGPDTSFQIGRNERMPDVSFVAAARIPGEGEPEGAWPIPPDLAVEIVSPTDLHEKLMTKILEYLSAGVRQVWLISPEHRTVTVYSSYTDVKIVDEAGELGGGDVIPGFRLPVAELFRNPAHTDGSANGRE